MNNVSSAAVIRAFGKLPKQIDKRTERFLNRAAFIVHRDAVRNAPISPNQNQINKFNKSCGDGERKMRPRDTDLPEPGGLERSIEKLVSGNDAIIFVAANSDAGSYAAKIHDEKGETWFKRGIGTISKGSKADDKFIERAIDCNKRNIEKIFNNEMGKVKL
jgi:hypothetical protein